MAKRSNIWSLWWETASAMNAAATTIAIRTLRAHKAMLSGDLPGGAEASRMTSEKARAAADGYLAGMTAFSKIAMTPLLTFGAASEAAAKVARASMRPGYAKARANARRLTRRRA